MRGSVSCRPSRCVSTFAFRNAARETVVVGQRHRSRKKTPGSVSRSAAACPRSRMTCCRQPSPRLRAACAVEPRSDVRLCRGPREVRLGRCSRFARLLRSPSRPTPRTPWRASALARGVVALVLRQGARRSEKRRAPKSRGLAASRSSRSRVAGPVPRDGGRRKQAIET